MSRLIGARVVAWTGQRSGSNSNLDQHGTITDTVNDHPWVWVRWDSDGEETVYRLDDLIKEMPA